MKHSKLYSLERRKHRAGDVVQRFGSFKKNVPEVLLPMNEWYALGSPNEVELRVELKK